MDYTLFKAFETLRQNQAFLFDHSGFALEFADYAHTGEGQLRKYTNEPYIVHPYAVGQIVLRRADRRFAQNEAVISAAYLHDVLEDTNTTEGQLRTLFGDYVTRLVVELTDVSKPSDGPREVRKALDRHRLANVSPEAQTIKLADLIDNTRSIVQHDPAFAKIYLREKAALLEVLTRGCSVLHREATALLKDALKTIEE